jgi:hypothetical protein
MKKDNREKSVEFGTTNHLGALKHTNPTESSLKAGGDNLPTSRLAWDKLTPLLSFAWLTVVTLFGAYAYAAYQTYMKAYNQQLGIVTDVFKPSIQEAIYAGFVQSLVVSLTMTVIAVGSGALMVGVAISVAWATFKFDGWGAKSNKAAKPAIWHNRIDKSFVYLGFSVIGIGLAALIFLVLFAFPLGMVEKQGQQDAATVKKEIDTAETRSSEHKYAEMRVREGDQVQEYKGYLIACNLESACAIRQHQRTRVIPTKELLSLDVRMRKCEPSPSPQAGVRCD